MTDARNVLGPDVEITGELKFQSDLIIDGKIDGKIISTGNLTIGENAVIKGQIRAGRVTVYGIVEGNLVITDHCTLQPTCHVMGDIEAKSLTMTEGASFSGMSLIGSKKAV